MRIQRFCGPARLLVLQWTTVTFNFCLNYSHHTHAPENSDRMRNESPFHVHFWFASIPSCFCIPLIIFCCSWCCQMAARSLFPVDNETKRNELYICFSFFFVLLFIWLHLTCDAQHWPLLVRLQLTKWPLARNMLKGIKVGSIATQHDPYLSRTHTFCLCQTSNRNKSNSHTDHFLFV